MIIILLIKQMGCGSLPTTLKGWAEYCDCLEGSIQSQIIAHTESSEPSQKQSQIHQHKLQTLPSKFTSYPAIAELKEEGIEELAPIKRTRTPHNRSKQDYMQLRNNIKKQQIESLSDISEIKPQKDGVVDISRMDESTIPSSFLSKLYKPTILNAQNKNLSKTHLIMRYLPQHLKEDKDQLPAQNDVHFEAIDKSRYFMNDDEKQEFQMT